MRALARIAVYALLASPLSAAIASGCGSSTDTSTSGSGASASTQSGSASGGGTASGGAGTSSGGAGTSSGGAGVGGGVAVTQCTDGIDNDMDGLTDEWDPECVGPLDNDESSFATGIPGDNKDPCKQDCFFDGNSGQGDDKCEWDLQCDPESPGAPKCPYDPNKTCKGTQADACIKFCGALTPNGCDCFGCCIVPNGSGGTVTIELGSAGCDEEHLSDPTICKPCSGKRTGDSTRSSSSSQSAASRAS